jgi:hypothetical protein
MAQILKNESIFLQETNTAGYVDINYDDMDITDPVRTAQLWAAGCIALLHIVRTGTGPHPLNPILLYLSIEADPNLLVNKDFIEHFDTLTTGPFFKALGHVETRRFLDRTPFLKPFDVWLLVQRGRPVSAAMSSVSATMADVGEQAVQIEVPHVQNNAILLRKYIVSMLGEILGVRGFLRDERRHPDVQAFSSGFRDCLSNTEEITERVSL